MWTMAVVKKGHRGRAVCTETGRTRAQLTKVDQGTDDCGSGTENRVIARYREAAAQARAHGRQWLWQCRARLRSSCAGEAGKQWLVRQGRKWLVEAAAAQGGWAKPGLTDTVAQVGREKRNEVKVDGPSPSPFIN